MLRKLIGKHGPCTLQSRSRPPFHTLVWAIINQQLSVKAAQAIEQKLLARLGGDVFQPGQFYRVREKTLRDCGLSAAKVRYIRHLAGQVRNNSLSLDQLSVLDDEAVSVRLMALPGIGRWTADMFLMFSLGRLDVLPIGDLALRKSIRHHYALGDDADLDDYLQVAENWRPYRTVASWYCWAAVD